MGAGGIQGPLTLRDPDPEERVAAVMAGHGRTLLRIAHHWSLCHDDALDAYQRGLEIFLKRAETVDPATEVAWLKVVIKHEAMAIRRARQDSVAGEEPDLDAHAPPSQRSIEEQIAGGERVSRSAEALRALKPDEARALMLKAEGLSYREIGERCGWTYTKVNRAITEGRRRFMEAYRAIESGDECERFAPTLAALAGGTASSAEVVAIRPHLRHCLACRATVRELHMTRLRRMRLLLPAFVLAPLRRLKERAGVEEHPDGIRSAEEILRESPQLDLPSVTTAPDAPVPHVTDLGGQLTLPLDLPERLEHARGLRLGRVKEEALALLHRTSSSDVAAGIHVATASGGGRIATIATLIGFCVSGAGAGALCVATGVIQAPGWILPREQAGPAKPRARTPARKPSTPAHVTATARTSEIVATATATPVARTEADRTRARRTRDPS
ncbi:MAG: RNA polymerase sigma factor, partial [Solirubrobacteraceae bacterium]